MQIRQADLPYTRITTLFCIDSSRKNPNHLLKKSTFNFDLAAVLFCTFATFSTFYAPQPLLPLLGRQFAVPPTSVALIITVTFAALCVAPLFYGALLQQVSAKSLLFFSLLLLAATQWWFAMADSFSSLLMSRMVQALLYPAIFTAAVTYCSQAGPDDKVAARVSLYIALTILGGVFGRVASGFIASWFEWSLVFQYAALLLLLSSAMVLAIKPDQPTRSNVKSNTIAAEVITNPTFLHGYLLIFTTFFAFSATLNALPFRLVELQADISPARISLVYSGYVLGMVVATNTTTIANRCGGRVRAMSFALIIFITGLTLLSVAITWWLIGVCFLTAGGMFLIHSTLSGFLTSLRPQHASVINGLYIAIYYGAGALGSVLPLWIYKSYGWPLFLVSITLTATLGFASLRRLNLESQRHLRQQKDKRS